MTVYRVGEHGATVFGPDGDPITWLPPGHVVVPGSTELSGTLAAQHADNVQVREKRRTGYDDKALHPTPPRQPDPRLRNPLAGSG